MTWPAPSGAPQCVQGDPSDPELCSLATSAPGEPGTPAVADPTPATRRSGDGTLVLALTLLLVVDALGPGLLPDPVHAVSITILLLAVALRIARQEPVRLRLTAPFRVAFVLVVAALGIGLVRGNELGSTAADLYHWSVECFLAFAVMGMVIRAKRVTEFRRSFVLSAVVASAVSVAIAVSGQAVRHSIGGNPTSGELWRLSMNRAFPIIVIVGLAVIWRLDDSDRGERRLVAVAGFLAAVALLFTLKRVQVVGLLIALPILFAGRFALTARTRTLARLTVPLLGIGLLFVVIPGLGRSLLPSLDYSNYSTITSVDVRRLQYRDAVGEMLDHPLGHGLGAEIQSWIPAGGHVILGDTNYLHSSYLQAGIQVGLPFLVLGVVGVVVLLRRAVAVPIASVRPDARWLLVFALFGIPVLLVLSLSLVATDTVWFGMLLAVLAFARALRDDPLASPAGERS